MAGYGTVALVGGRLRGSAGPRAGVRLGRACENDGARGQGGEKALVEMNATPLYGRYNSYGTSFH